MKFVESRKKERMDKKEKRRGEERGIEGSFSFCDLFPWMRYFFFERLFYKKN